MRWLVKRYLRRFDWGYKPDSDGDILFRVAKFLDFADDAGAAHASVQEDLLRIARRLDSIDSWERWSRQQRKRAGHRTQG